MQNRYTVRIESFIVIFFCIVFGGIIEHFPKLPCTVRAPDGSVISHGTACVRDRMKAHPQKDEFFFSCSIQSLSSVPHPFVGF
jgi:hypothetical protein